MNSDVLEISDDERDALKELSTIGAGHAATALSQLVKTPIGITLPKVSFLFSSDAKTILKKNKQTYVATKLNALGDISGTLFLIFELKKALTTVDTLFHLEKQTTDELDDKANSAINEVGNVIVASFLNTLSKFLNLTILPSVPEIIVGNKDEITKKFSSEKSSSEESIISNNALLFLSDKAGAKIDIDTYLVWVTTKKDVRLLLDKLDEKLESISSSL